MTTGPFTEAASDAAEERWTREHTPGHPLSGPTRMNRRIGFTMGAEWARTHLAAQEPTDAEVEAAARLLNLRGWTCFDGAHEPGEYDQCEQCRTACTGLARSVINTARAARRDEEDR